VGRPSGTLDWWTAADDDFHTEIPCALLNGCGNTRPAAAGVSWGRIEMTSVQIMSAGPYT